MCSQIITSARLAPVVAAAGNIPLPHIDRWRIIGRWPVAAINIEPIVERRGHRFVAGRHGDAGALIEAGALQRRGRGIADPLIQAGRVVAFVGWLHPAEMPRAGVGGRHPEHLAHSCRVVAGIVWIKRGQQRLRRLCVGHAAGLVGIADEHRRDAAGRLAGEPRDGLAGGRHGAGAIELEQPRDRRRIDRHRHELGVIVRGRRGAGEAAARDRQVLVVDRRRRADRTGVAQPGETVGHHRADGAGSAGARTGLLVQFAGAGKGQGIGDFLHLGREADIAAGVERQGHEAHQHGEHDRHIGQDHAAGILAEGDDETADARNYHHHRNVLNAKTNNNY